MKPVNITQPRVNIELGDLIYIMGLAKMLFVQEIRSNRRKISGGTLTTTESEVTISDDSGWAKGTIPGRIIRLQGLGIQDTSGNGQLTDLNIGKDSAFSLDNVTSVVLDTNTCGESGGSDTIGQLRWGNLPIDIWLWDGQTITATCQSTSGEVTTLYIVLDVIELKTKEITLKEVAEIGPSTVVLVSRHGSGRMKIEDFQKRQSLL